MPVTKGINHVGLTVNSLLESTAFFVDILGWQESGYDASYPRTAVSDGTTKITLWQVDHHRDVGQFDRRKNIGLHHLALEVESEDALYDLHKKMQNFPSVEVEFAPELLGSGPRKHMMCLEPSGIRIEFIWPGTPSPN